jgi:hypothetical protein
MREFVFTIEYETGADPTMDVFIEHPAAHARTITCQVSEHGMWRLERLAGPEAALERLDEHYTNPYHCECLGEQHCHTEWHGEVLDAEAGRRTVYCYRPEPGDCHSVPRLATDCLGDGALFGAERRERLYEWRLLLPDDDGVRETYERLAAELRGGLSLTFRQLGDPGYWTEEAVTVAELPPEQRAALEAAVERGYYRTPREITLPDLADATGVPRSTLQYRLQRAEEWILTRFVSQSTGPLVPSVD